MRKQTGGSLGSLFASLLPYAMKALPALATGALGGVGSAVASKATKKVIGDGLFSVPQSKVDKLIQYKSYLTKAQKDQITKALQTGSGIPIFKLSLRLKMVDS